MNARIAPVHDEISWATRTMEIVSIAGAITLLAVNIVRLWRAGALTSWPTPLAIAGGALAADLVSGLVHWSADTWGRETMPVLGPRFLRPFRVHHVNPHDFLRRDPIDCNGDVAMLNIPLLAAALAIPLTAAIGSLGALSLVAFCAVSLPTNQVHQWAHMPSPPRPIAWLQRRGVVLSREDHARHHREPYIANYCIATGWCNRALTAIGFFPALERAITAATGLRPREDEERFQW